MHPARSPVPPVGPATRPLVVLIAVVALALGMVSSAGLCASVPVALVPVPVTSLPTTPVLVATALDPAALCPQHGMPRCDAETLVVGAQAAAPFAGERARWPSARHGARPFWPAVEPGPPRA